MVKSIHGCMVKRSKNNKVSLYVAKRDLYFDQNDPFVIDGVVLIENPLPNSTEAIISLSSGYKTNDSFIEFMDTDGVFEEKSAILQTLNETTTHLTPFQQNITKKITKTVSIDKIYPFCLELSNHVLPSICHFIDDQKFHSFLNLTLKLVDASKHSDELSDIKFLLRKFTFKHYKKHDNFYHVQINSNKDISLQCHLHNTFYQDEPIDVTLEIINHFEYRIKSINVSLIQLIKSVYHEILHQRIEVCKDLINIDLKVMTYEKHFVLRPDKTMFKDIHKLAIDLPLRDEFTDLSPSSISGLDNTQLLKYSINYLVEITIKYSNIIPKTFKEDIPIEIIRRLSPTTEDEQ